MEPLSPRVRNLYLVLFVILFFAMIPIVIFYADGWRYKSGYGFVRTGGIYVGVPYPDALVSVNGEEIGRSGFLERSFYIGDLAPSAYIVHVERDGYVPWDRLLVVEEQLVTDTHAFLIPREIHAVKIVAATTTDFLNTSTTTRIIARDDYDDFLAVFAATTTASTTIPLDEQDGIGLFLVRGALFARWIQENSFPTSRFCERPSHCVDELTIEKTGVTSARFFRGHAAYATRDGVFLKELDIREVPVAARLLQVRNADIRVIDDQLYVKSGTNLFEIRL